MEPNENASRVTAESDVFIAEGRALQLVNGSGFFERVTLLVFTSKDSLTPDVASEGHQTWVEISHRR